MINQKIFEIVRSQIWIFDTALVIMQNMKTKAKIILGESSEKAASCQVKYSYY